MPRTVLQCFDTEHTFISYSKTHPAYCAITYKMHSEEPNSSHNPGLGFCLGPQNHKTCPWNMSKRDRRLWLSAGWTPGLAAVS